MLCCTREQVDGTSVPAHKALYVATVQDSSDALDQASARPISPGAIAAHLPYSSVNHVPRRPNGWHQGDQASCRQALILVAGRV